MPSTSKQKSKRKSETKRYQFYPFNRWSGLTYRQRDGVASLGRLADALKEIGEGGLGMLEAAGNKVFAYDDAAVFAMIDSIAGL